MENQKALPDLITFLYLLKTLKKTEIRSSFFPFLVAFDPSQNRRHRIRTTQIPTKKEQITKLREPTLQRSIRFHSSTNLHCCQKTSKWTERNSSRKASLLSPCLSRQDHMSDWATTGHAVTHWDVTQCSHGVDSGRVRFRKNKYGGWFYPASLGRGGGTLWNFWWGCAARISKSRPNYFRPLGQHIPIYLI